MLDMISNTEIKFIRVQTVSRHLAEPIGVTASSEINFTYGYNVEIKIQNKTNIVFVLTQLSLNNPENNNLLATLKTACIFEFKQFATVFKEVEGKIHTPIDIEILLKGSGISTTRGLFVSELRGTYLQDIVFPLVDVTTQIKKDRERQNIPDYLQLKLE